MQLQSELKITLLSLFIALVVVACGGSGDDSGANASSGSQEVFVPFSDYTLDEQESAGKLIEDLNSAMKLPPSLEAIGEDRDADGVRDDVQAYIDTTYMVGTTLHSRTMKLAREEQRILIIAHDAELVRDNLLPYEIALSCWLFALDRSESIGAIRAYAAAVENTDERIFRGLVMDGQLAKLQGELPSINESNCE